MLKQVGMIRQTFPDNTKPIDIRYEKKKNTANDEWENLKSRWKKMGRKKKRMEDIKSRETIYRRVVAGEKKEQ